MTAAREGRALPVLLIPYVIGLILLVAIPAGSMLWLSLHDEGGGTFVFSGLANFEELWGDEAFHGTLWRSLGFIAIAVPLRFVAAVGLAMLLHRPMRGGGVERAAVSLPTVLPDVAYALVWLWVLNPFYGPLNAVLGAVGLAGPDWLGDPGAASWAIVVMSIFTVGEGFLIALAVRRQIPPHLYELAALEDVGAFQRLRRLTLPLMAPTLALLLFRDTVFALHWTFVPSLLVTEGGPAGDATTYLPLFVYRAAFESERYGYASAASLVMVGVTAVVIGIQYLIVRRWRRAFTA